MELDMKKIGKVKILEVGRICTPEELRQICGGSGIDGESNSGACTFTGCNKYNNCGWFSHETCSQVSAHYGYENNGSSILCSDGYSYSSCSLRTYTSCGGDKTYVA